MTRLTSGLLFLDLASQARPFLPEGVLGDWPPGEGLGDEVVNTGTRRTVGGGGGGETAVTPPCTARGALWRTVSSTWGAQLDFQQEGQEGSMTTS